MHFAIYIHFAWCMMHLGLFADCKLSLQLSRSCEAPRRCMWSGVVSTFQCYPCCEMVRCRGGLGLGCWPDSTMASIQNCLFKHPFFCSHFLPPKKKHDSIFLHAGHVRSTNTSVRIDLHLYIYRSILFEMQHHQQRFKQPPGVGRSLPER